MIISVVLILELCWQLDWWSEKSTLGKYYNRSKKNK